MQELYVILLYSALYAFTMKLADLLNEHGLRLFKGDALIFGALWGMFGALLVSINLPLANIILAMNLAFLLRGSLDYINHRIAATIIIVTFLFTSVIDPRLFTISLIVFTLAGFLEDKSHIISKKSHALGLVSDCMFYYLLLGLWYALTYENLIVFFSLTLFTIVYCITKYSARAKGYK